MKRGGGVITSSGLDGLRSTKAQHLTHEVFEEPEDNFCGLGLQIQTLWRNELEDWCEQKCPHLIRMN